MSLMAGTTQLRGNEEFVDTLGQVTGILIYEAHYEKSNSDSDATEVPTNFGS